MTYPSNCIKGIQNDTFLTKEGTPGTHLFFFKEPDRGDGWSEQSINWEDMPDVISFTLRQRRSDGRVDFAAGLALIPRAELDRIASLPMVANRLSYERDELPDVNPYHGNLLLQADTPDPTMKQIAANLALAVNKLIPQTESV